MPDELNILLNWSPIERDDKNHIGIALGVDLEAARVIL